MLKSHEGYEDGPLAMVYHLTIISGPRSGKARARLTRVTDIIAGIVRIQVV